MGLATRFRDRRDAGRVLAGRLAGYVGHPGMLVLALPRGGVPVAFEVASALGAPLEVLVVGKLGVPGHEEVAMGAIASGGVRVLNREVVKALNISRQMIDDVTVKEQAELARRERVYRGERPAPEVGGRTIILVDDGLATGTTMRAAIAALRPQQPARLVVAVPTGDPSTCEKLKNEADEVVCVRTPEPFYAIGLWYEDFSQTTDDEIRELLDRARELAPERS